MASYELAFLTKVIPKAELAVILRRTADSVFQRGGIIRRIDNLGPRRTPYKISSHEKVHREANYFIFEFSVPPSRITDLIEECNRDVDIIRNRIYKVQSDDCTECSLDEELKPAPYRSAVIQLIEHAKKKESRRPKFEYNTGLNYYPFQK